MGSSKHEIAGELPTPRRTMVVHGCKGTLIGAPFIRVHPTTIEITTGQEDTFHSFAGESMPALLVLAVRTAEAAPAAVTRFSFS